MAKITNESAVLRVSPGVHLAAKIEATKRGLSLSEYVEMVLRKILGMKEAG